jgi:hypothetical protein
VDTQHSLGIMEIIGIAGSVSLLSGWRLYLAVLATGIAMRAGIVPLPDHLAALGVLADPWVMGCAALAALVEFFADKVMWLDSVWDAVHTLIRPLGGALLALALVDPAILSRKWSRFCWAAAARWWRMAARLAPARW